MPQSKRVVAVGDIHGCAVALRALIDALQPTADDLLIVLGDAVDRGPDSRGVIEQLLCLREQCELVCLMGNHEQMLLDSFRGLMPERQWHAYGGAETLHSYAMGDRASMVPNSHLEFLATWRDYFEIENHFFAHGNYLPDLPFEQQPWHQLRWRSLHEVVPRAHQSGKMAVLGHTSNKHGRIVNLGYLACIDTFCHGGGWLTAFDAISGRVWQAAESGECQSGELPPRRRSWMFGWP